MSVLLLCATGWNEVRAVRRAAAADPAAAGWVALREDRPAGRNRRVVAVSMAGCAAWTAMTGPATAAAAALVGPEAVTLSDAPDSARRDVGSCHKRTKEHGERTSPCDVTGW